MTQENKEAQYREEAIRLYNDDNLFCKNIDVADYIYGYRAGRKKGDEDSESWKRIYERQVTDSAKENIELKKELDELSFDKNHLLELGDLRKDENQKLRDLVKRAELIMTTTIINWRDTRDQWVKEAEAMK